MSKLKVMLIGFGPIGQTAVKYILQRNNLQLVAVVDLHPDKVGKNLNNICWLDTDPGIIISLDISEALKNSQPDVALVTTVSSFKTCALQIEEIAARGINVVSTCEEMAYPWLTHPELSRQLDETAKQHNVALLGTGVNPGFLMDFLPAALTGICRDVQTIKVSRLQDASIRRIPFQQKIGAGLILDEFEAKKQTGTLRHVGLTESLHLIAYALGWRLDKTEDILSPVIAQKNITTGYKTIEPGMASGVQQIGKGYRDGKEVITLLFRAAVGEPYPADTIEIKGTPDVTSTIPGGINGDVATCSIAVNALSSITRAAPGLRVMTDIPTVSCFDKG